MIVQWIIEQLQQHKLQPEDLAARVGVPGSTVAEWFYGSLEPTREQLARVSEWLGDPFHPPGLFIVSPLPAAPQRGAFVCVTGCRRGVGKLREIDNNQAVIAFYRGPRHIDEVTVPRESVCAVLVAPETRCYIGRPDRAAWEAGRIGHYTDGIYEVHWPDRHSGYVPESDLYVRSVDSQISAAELLAARAHETGFFHARRVPVIGALTSHRRRTHGLAGLISARVQLLQHQVEVIRRVTSDPVQRYLLADEVGLGKTIEACAIARQHLLDDQSARVWMVVPEGLLEQWREEWNHRFAIYPHDPRVKILPYHRIADQEDSPTLLIVDEAHHIAAGAWEASETRVLFQAVERLAHNTQALLLLSATPAATHADEFLAMLHLLNPEGYRLEDRKAFAERVYRQQALGEALMGMEEDDPSFLLAGAVEDLRSLLADDPDVQVKASFVLDLLNAPDAEPTQFIPPLRELKTQVSETYRLHRRMLRSRRQHVQATPYGRSTEHLLEEWGMDEREALTLELLEQWRLDALSAGGDSTLYAPLYQTLLEIAGCDLALLRSTIESRRDGKEPPKALASADRIALQVALFEGEKQWLDALSKACALPVEPGDLDRSDLIAAAVENVLQQGEHVVIFASYSAVARKLARQLEKVVGEELVARRLEGMDAAALHTNIVRFLNTERGSVLICDASGEEGVNLQRADRVMFYDLPFAPNRLEQRLGRLDRLGRIAPLHVSVLLGPEPTGETPTPYEAWYTILREGLGLFSDSIASLQFLVDRQVPEMMHILFEGGASALQAQLENVQKAVSEERRRNASQDLLDSFDAQSEEADALYANLQKDEAVSEAFGERLDLWLRDALHFEVHTAEGGRVYVPTPPPGGTLVPSDLVLHRFLPLVNRPTTFDRSVALERSRLELARIGHPLVDHTAAYLRWDDRGRAFAVRRHAPELARQGRSAWWGFRFEWVLEADIEPAVKVLAQGRDVGAIARAALRRRADALLPPQMHVAFVDSTGTPVEDPLIQRLLRPLFKKKREGGQDLNLTKDRIDQLDRYIAAHRWSNTVRTAATASEQHLRAANHTQAWISEAEQRLERERAKHLSTLQLRERRGLIQTDVIRHEEALFDALLEGIHAPRLWLDAAGFIALEPHEDDVD